MNADGSRTKIRLFAVLTSVLLSGCSETPPNDPQQPDPQQPLTLTISAKEPIIDPKSDLVVFCEIKNVSHKQIGIWEDTTASSRFTFVWLVDGNEAGLFHPKGVGGGWRQLQPGAVSRHEVRLIEKGKCYWMVSSLNRMPLQHQVPAFGLRGEYRLQARFNDILSNEIKVRLR